MTAAGAATVSMTGVSAVAAPPAGHPFAERAVVFDCERERLVGVLSLPERPARVGVVIVVGGPQYRAGSHRQFVLLARRLAAAGAAVLRFDYRGMGDSSGPMRDFENVDADIRRAIDALMAGAPAVARVLLWGLCDAASAAMMYAPSDERVAALALANPWARASDTLARAQLRHYYVGRLMSKAFWSKVLSGGLRIAGSLRSLSRTVRDATRSTGGARADFRAAMLDGIERFGRHGRPALFVLSGRDLTAQEFLAHAAGEPRWQRVLTGAGTRRLDLPGADHTLTDAAASDAAFDATLELLRSIELSATLPYNRAALSDGNGDGNDGTGLAAAAKATRDP